MNIPSVSTRPQQPLTRMQTFGLKPSDDASWIPNNVLKPQVFDIAEFSSSGIKDTLYQYVPGQGLTQLGHKMENTWLSDLPAEQKFARFNQVIQEVKDWSKDLIEKQQGVSTLPVIRLGVATGAFRKDPAHLNPFLQYAQQELQMPIRVISGQEEGDKMYAGTYTGLIEQYPDLKGKKVVTLDPGGRSTELVAGRSVTPDSTFSFEIGESSPEWQTLNKSFKLQDVQTVHQLAVQHLQDTLKQHPELKKEFGNADTAVQGFALSQSHTLRQYLQETRNLDLFEKPIARQELEKLFSSQEELDRLKKRTHEICHEHGNTQPYGWENAERIPTNLATLTAIMKVFDIDSVQIKDSGGVRRGQAIELSHQA